MKYKVGDKVRIKSLDWYKQMLSIPNKLVWQNKLTNDFVGIWCGSHIFKESMFGFLGKTMTIQEVGIDFYLMEEDTCGYEFNDEMIEGLVEDENNHLTETIVDTVRESNDRYRIVIDPRFDIEVDEGEYYAVRRKKEYPKTYEECAMLLGLGVLNELKHYNLNILYKKDLIVSFQKLLICLDAYWKIAGDEMGLGKPWEPDYSEESYEQGCPVKYVIYFTGTHITKERKCTPSYVLSFPTEEMRDAFYENFKEEIEFVKELL